MNLFFPEKDAALSVMALDDRRLIKQIVECQTMLNVYYGKTKGYANHPVVKYYKRYPQFVAIYGMFACYEYEKRFGKEHKLVGFMEKAHDDFKGKFEIFPTPFYAAGRKGTAECIRTTENACDLFREKLRNKWDNDKIPPKWTNRERPIWYSPISYLKGDENEK